MNRRRALLAVAAILASARAQAQPAVRKIGFLYFGSRESAVRTGRYDAFLNAMRTLGYAPGKDLHVEERFTEGKVELLSGYAADLVRLQVEVIVTAGAPAAREAKNATGRIPIVIAQVGGDPVRSGFGKSLARPGGNVTGVYVSNVELLPKQLEMLAAVAPKAARVAVLANPDNPIHAGLLQTLQPAARSAGLEVVRVQARSATEIDAAFGEMDRARVGGLLILGDTFFVQQARQLATLALKHRLPLVSTTREYADAGGLIAYGEDSRENFRLAAEYVDKILKGAHPGDLPFRRSQRPLLVLNARTFKALALAVPQELAARADEVIR